MKVYQGRWFDGNIGVCLVWGSSKAAVMREAKARVKENSGEFYSIDQLDIPTDRNGLCKWLNTYFDTDNG